ncbi:MAG: cupin domain-containing protein [Chloroflexota bacterium]|nr:cupin domain-containing protein [Chloroflexota bacterium]
MLRTFAACLALLLLLAVAPRIGGAQDEAATPLAGPRPAEAAPRRETLIRATFDRGSPEPVALRLLRIVLEPDGFSKSHAHPGVELGVVEAGTLVVQVEGRAVLLRADADVDAGSMAVPAGVEVSLGPGDRIAYAAGTLMTFRNPGPDQTTILAATILPTGPDAPPGAVYPGGLPTAEETAGIRSFLLGTVVAELPPSPSGVVLERLQLTAGDVLPAFAGPVLAVIEEGALTGSVLDGPFELLESPAAATPVAEADLALAAGQAIYFPSGMAATAPLGGAGSVVLLRLGIVPLAETAAIDPPAITAVTESPAVTETATTTETIPVDARVVVVVDEARLRDQPSLDGLLVTGLSQDTVLVVTGGPVTDPDRVWYPVLVADDPAFFGFIAAELITPEP